MDKVFELSDYQKNIMNFISTQRGNLLVDAKAGSGKTSTLILIADELTKSGNKCLFLAFNKHIVEELDNKICNENCKVRTVHSLGYYFIYCYLVRKHGFGNFELETDNSKLRTLVRDYYEQNFKKRLDLYNATGSTDEDFITSDMINENMMSEQEMKDLHNNIISDFVGLCNFSRLYNINYKDKEHPDNMRKLVKKFCWYLYPYIDDVLEDYQDLVIAVIDKTKELFENPEKDLTGKPHYKIDYTDMLYFPVLYNMSVPYKIKEYINTVLVDECIPADTYVETNNGKSLLREIKRKVNKGETILVKTFNEQTETFEYKPVISVTDKGIKEVFEIETNGLNKIQATANHPFLTQNGWKRLDELNIGVDYLYLDKPNNQKTKYIPNDDQLQLIYASSIGDGSLEKGKYDYEYRIKFIQGNNQYNYFKFKKEIMNCCFEYKSKSGYTGVKSINNTISKQFILPVNNRISIIDNLDIRGLAILYMDDGSKLTKYDTCGVRISCNNLTIDEVNHLINRFNFYDICVKNIPHNGYNEISINSENADKFFKLIAPYMHPDCFYKNPYSTGTYNWNNKFKEFGGNIVKRIYSIGNKQVLDMEVADNHNFCISKFNQKNGSAVVVHNCQDLSVLQQKFIRKLDTNFNRYIFVGDKRTIYICICWC